jgi:hypothetical protein
MNPYLKDSADPLQTTTPIEDYTYSICLPSDSIPYSQLIFYSSPILLFFFLLSILVNQTRKLIEAIR